MGRQVIEVDFHDRKIIRISETPERTKTLNLIGRKVIAGFYRAIFEPIIFPEELESRLRVSEAGHTGDFSELRDFVERRRAQELLERNRRRTHSG
ncbi:hypothetical protein HYW35_02730 [Candidatus Saccharibacteria bacterium]|nr:hypothetical protein [Candidatus Saccharibacteria bacterium]